MGGSESCYRSNSGSNPGILPNIVHEVKTPGTVIGPLGSKRVIKKCVPTSVSLEEEIASITATTGNDIGPYGDQDDEQVCIITGQTRTQLDDLFSRAV